MPRLYWRIYLHFLGVLFVVGLAATIVFAVGQRRAFQRQVTERVTRHVAALVAEVAGDPAALARRLEQLRDDLGLDVTVRDPGGRVLAATGSELWTLAADELAELRAGGLLAPRGSPWMAGTALRAPGSGALIGFVQLSAGHRHFPMTGFWRPGLAVIAVLVIVALAAAPLARRIARPVERLTEGARRLGRGELAYRVPEEAPRGLVRRRRRHPSELAELTRAFNDMAGRVERLVAGQKELLANVSHELRSPLARIRVALALLPREGGTEQRLREVEADLAELDRLIDEVLTAARLDATSVPPQRSPVDVGRLLAEVAERAGQDPATAGTTVRVAPGPAPVLVADATLLKRALWNLVENAAKYGAPPVMLAAGRVGDRVALSVTDEGPGIPAADRERVLAPFQRLDAARTPSAAGEPPRGVGLGLTIARRVAEVHGGTIAVEPAAVVEGRERGCRVTLWLPAEP